MTDESTNAADHASAQLTEFEHGGLDDFGH